MGPVQDAACGVLNWIKVGCKNIVLWFSSVSHHTRSRIRHVKKLGFRKVVIILLTRGMLTFFLFPRNVFVAFFLRYVIVLGDLQCIYISLPLIVLCAVMTVYAALTHSDRQEFGDSANQLAMDSWPYFVVHCASSGYDKQTYA